MSKWFASINGEMTVLNYDFGIIGLLLGIQVLAVWVLRTLMDSLRHSRLLARLWRSSHLFRCKVDLANREIRNPRALPVNDV